LIAAKITPAVFHGSVERRFVGPTDFP